MLSICSISSAGVLTLDSSTLDSSTLDFSTSGKAQLHFLLLCSPLTIRTLECVAGLECPACNGKILCCRVGLTFVRCWCRDLQCEARVEYFVETLGWGYDCSEDPLTQETVTSGTLSEQDMRTHRDVLDSRSLSGGRCQGMGPVKRGPPFERVYITANPAGENCQGLWR